MIEPITREDIAEIYEQLGVIEMRKITTQDPRDIGEHSLDRAFEFYNRADQFREIDKLNPLVKVRGMYVRSESNVW
jgi:hypothetical protein